MKEREREGVREREEERKTNKKKKILFRKSLSAFVRVCVCLCAYYQCRIEAYCVAMPRCINQNWYISKKFPFKLKICRLLL